jgi:hypothetical protein
LSLATRFGAGTIGGADLHSGIVALERRHDLRLIPSRGARELGDGGAAGFARKCVDEADTAGRFVDGKTEHRGRLALPLIAAAAPALLGRDIGALDTGDVIAGIVPASFHRTDLDLRRREVVPQHLLLVEGVGDQLGECRIGLGLADHARRLELRIACRVAGPLKCRVAACIIMP